MKFDFKKIHFRKFETLRSLFKVNLRVEINFLGVDNKSEGIERKKVPQSQKTLKQIIFQSL